MRSLAIVGQGARGGALFGALYFLADLLGTSAAIHFLIDRTVYQLVLVAVAFAATLALAVPIGVVVSIAWAIAKRPGLSRQQTQRLAAAAFVIIAVAGYVARVGRAEVDAGPRKPASNTPAVLWIVLDTLRADTLYGPAHDFPLAPNLKAFAQNATVFSDAESAAGWTIPATATLLTGFHPETLGSARASLPEWAPTIAERLHDAGYATHAVVDNAILEPRNGFAAGFETFHQRSALRFAFTFPAFRALPRLAREYLRESMPVFYEGAEHVTDAALAHLATNDGAPLFLYAHYMDVHYPYYPHPEFGPDPAGVEPMQLQPVMEDLRYGAGAEVTEAQLEFLRHRYRNELRYLDVHLGRLLDAWHARFGDDAVVLITADHGEEFLEHGGLGHGSSLYKELVHVPLVLKLPKRVLPNPPARIDVPIGSVNLLPTTLAALGISPDAGGYVMEGESLLPFLRGQAEAPTQPLFASQKRHARRIFRVRKGNDVFIDSVHIDLGPKTEAFDKATDYAEMRDVAAQKPELVSRMREELDRMLERQAEAREPKPTRDPGNEESLRALGYVQ